MSIVTLAEVKQYLRIPTSDTTNDVLLQSLIDSVESYIKQEIWILASTTVKEKINVCDVSIDWSIYLKNNVISISKINGQAYSWIDWKDFIIDSNKIIVKNIGNYLLWLEFMYFDIEYVWWYSTIPEDIKLALKMLVGIEFSKDWWKNIESYTLWPRTVKFNLSANKESLSAMSMLNKYKKFILKKY